MGDRGRLRGVPLPLRSGREGDAPAAGFAPRKAASTIYLPDGVGAHASELARLGPHTTGVGCLYVKNLDDVDLAVLERIVASSYASVQRRAPTRCAPARAPRSEPDKRSGSGRNGS